MVATTSTRIVRAAGPDRPYHGICDGNRFRCACCCHRSWGAHRRCAAGTRPPARSASHVNQNVAPGYQGGHRRSCRHQIAPTPKSFSSGEPWPSPSAVDLSGRQAGAGRLAGPASHRCATGPHPSDRTGRRLPSTSDRAEGEARQAWQASAPRSDPIHSMRRQLALRRPPAMAARRRSVAYPETPRASRTRTRCANASAAAAPRLPATTRLRSAPTPGLAHR